MAVDGAGNLYIADYGFDPQGNSIAVVRKISADGVIISTLAESYAAAIAVDHDGNLYIADGYNSHIWKVSPAGSITTAAGNGTIFSFYSGDDGPAAGAQLNNPWGVAADGAGNVYIADTYNNRVRQVSPAGIITTVVGNGTYGNSGDGGPAINAQLNGPVALAVDSADSLYIADINNNCIRKVSGGIVTTVAGNGSAGHFGDGGPATSAQLFSPSRVRKKYGFPLEE